MERERGEFNSANELKIGCVLLSIYLSGELIIFFSLPHKEVVIFISTLISNSFSAPKAS